MITPEISALIFDLSYFKAIGAVSLLLASGQILNFFGWKRNPSNETARKVRIIIRSWWKILAVVFFGLILGKHSAAVVFFCLSLWAVKEYVAISSLRDFPIPLFFGTFFGISLHYSSFLLNERVLFFASMQIYFVLVVMPFLIFTPRPERLPELMAFYLGSMMIAVLMSFPVALMTFMEKVFANPNQARSAVLLLIVLTELNDIFQFICGKLFGRRKIIPKISPNKTEAGFIGGALLSSLASALIWPNVIPISTELAALLGLILSLAGMLGDLVCSAIKRFRGVKDFSDLIPGHGGILDRIDSLLATGPAFFYFLYFTIGRNG